MSNYPPFSGYTNTGGGGGGGGGAPVNATYLVLSLDATLTNERQFAPTARFAVTDNGAGATYVLDLNVSGVGAGVYAYPSSVTVDTYGRVTAIVAGAAPLASGWTDGGPVVYLTTSTDLVSIGNNVNVPNRKLSVYNTGTDLGVSVVTLASTDNVIETKVSGEVNLRWSVSGTGSTLWGAGGATVPDTRLYRSAAKTLTLDDGAAGGAALVPGADNVGNLGTALLRWQYTSATNYYVFPTAGAVNASTQVSTGAIKFGAGGASVLDLSVSRSAAKTLTIDDNAAGSITVIVKGATNTQQRIHAYTNKNLAASPYTTAATDEMVFWDCSGGNCTQNLPTPVGFGGRTLIVKRIDTSANTLTLTPAAGQIEGGASYVVAGGVNRASITIMSDNVNWWVI